MGEHLKEQYQNSEWNRDRVEHPRDYVVRVTHAEQPTRYERIGRIARRIVAGLVIAAAVAFAGYLIGVVLAPDARAQINADYARACQTIDSTHGFCG